MKSMELSTAPLQCRGRVLRSSSTLITVGWQTGDKQRVKDYFSHTVAFQCESKNYNADNGSGLDVGQNSGTLVFSLLPVSINGGWEDGREANE